MNRTLAALLGTSAVITGCTSGPVVGSPAEASPSLAIEPQATTPSAPPSPTPAATATPFPYSEEDVTVEAGTYHIRSSAWSVADFTVTFPDGWSVQYGHVFHPDPDRAGELEFYAVVVDAIYADACEGSNGELMEVGPSVDDLADALLQQPGPDASGPTETTLGGHPAVRIDLKVPQGSDLEACSMGVPAFRSGTANPPTSTSCWRPMAPRACTSSTSAASARYS